jgi:excisionase family DNA binding protein
LLIAVEMSAVHFVYYIMESIT